MKWEQEAGQCPACERETPVGAPCATPVCARRGLHGLPRAAAERYAALPRAAQDPMIGQLVGDSLVVAALGQGGFGVVYSVLQRPQFRLAAALKLMRPRDGGPELARRTAGSFEGEAAALAVLQHPNIVRLLQYGVHEGLPYLVIELVPGGRTLGDELDGRSGPASPGERARDRRILHQVLDALESAHAAGIVHRDVKPDNILLHSVPGNPDLVRILDFGLAKFLEHGSKTSIAVGTPFYMAPEQLSRQGIGPWTDLYAVGVLAFRLLSGRDAFEGDTTEEVLVCKLSPHYDPATRLAGVDLPPSALAFFRAALAVRPEDRYRTVEAFRSALDGVFADLSERDGEAAPGGRRRDPSDTAPAGLTVLGTLRAAARRAGWAAAARRAAAALARARRPLAVAAALVLAAVVVALLLPTVPGPAFHDRGTAAAVTGALIVKSEPPGATVLASGTARSLGTTPLRLSASDLAALPDRTVRLAAPDRWPVDYRLPPLAPGLVRESAVVLHPLPVVTVGSDPPGAEVRLVGADAPLGVTPFAWIVPAALADRPAPVALVARLDGHLDAHADVTLAALRAEEPIDLVLRPYNPAGIDWVPLEGGTFQMGADEERPLESELPVHTVTVAPFELSRSEVTVGQYRRCVEAGVCTPPAQDPYCGWGDPKRDAHPVNCVDREQAGVFAAWAGGRLPTEAEWEYAARGAGDARPFPWGTLGATCRRAVLHEGCEAGRTTWPVCAKPAGSTPQGLCDMAGNVAEWVADCWHRGYKGAPADGSAWTAACDGADGVARGGSWVDAGLDLRTFSRRSLPPQERRFSVGIRVAR